MRNIIGQLSRPWAIRAREFDIMNRIVLARVNGDQAGVEEFKSAAQKEGLHSEYIDTEFRGDVAIVSLVGIMAKRMSYFHAISGGTSTQMVMDAIRDVVADENISKIVLRIDSPGGNVDGTGELADYIASVEKPIHAWVDGCACSGAYWVASQCDSITLSTESGVVGSIGVYVAVWEQTAKDALEGYKTEVIKAGKYKAAGHPEQPLSDSDREVLQREVDEHHRIFIEQVAAGRGMDPRDLAETAQGQVFHGQAAISAGLIDAVGDLETCLAAISEGGALANPEEEASEMAGTKGTPAPPSANAQDQPAITAEYLAANHPDLAASIQQQGAAAERARITAVQGLALPGCEAIISAAIADGSTPEQTALKLNAHCQQNLAKQHGILSSEAPKAFDVPVPPAPGAQDKAGKPTTPEAEWGASAELQAEFPSAGAYAAYMRNQHREVTSGKG